MGRTYIRTVGDARTHGLVLHALCGMCGRETYLMPHDLIEADRGRARRRVWPHTLLVDLAASLRCRGGRGRIGCGGKDARLRAMWPHELRVPAGVPVAEFLMADDRERKRLIAKARG